MPIDVAHVKEVIARAANCRSGMIEVALDSLDFDAVRLAVQAGHLDWVANGTARITSDGREFLVPAYGLPNAAVQDAQRADQLVGQYIDKS